MKGSEIHFEELLDGYFPLRSRLQKIEDRLWSLDKQPAASDLSDEERGELDRLEDEARALQTPHFNSTLLRWIGRLRRGKVGGLSGIHCGKCGKPGHNANRCVADAVAHVDTSTPVRDARTHKEATNLFKKLNGRFYKLVRETKGRHGGVIRAADLDDEANLILDTILDEARALGMRQRGRIEKRVLDLREDRLVIKEFNTASADVQEVVLPEAETAEPGLRTLLLEQEQLKRRLAELEARVARLDGE